MSAVTIPSTLAPGLSQPSSVVPPTNTVAPLPPGGGWSRYRWTIAAYRELSKTGLFRDKKTILLAGEVYVMAMPKPPHDTALGLTSDYLRSAFPTGHFVRNQQGFDVGTDNDPGPDLAVVPGSIRDYADRTPRSAVMVVEVAHTTLFVDTTTKAELYATAGVPEYWVIDVENRRLLIYRDPEPLPAGLGATAYRTHTVHAPTDTVAPLAAPHAAITVADLLP